MRSGQQTLKALLGRQAMAIGAGCAAFDVCFSLVFSQGVGQRLMPNRMRILTVPEADRAKLARRVEGLRFSTDPQLEARIRDAVGLYLHPRENAVVVSHRP